MRTLLQIVANYVGENPNIFSHDVLQDLPDPVLEAVLPFLSAERLHELEECPKKLDVETDWLWKQHITRRWIKRQVCSFVNVFQETGLDPDPHNVYLMKHFHDLLSFCTFNKIPIDPFVPYTKDPVKVFKYPHQKLSNEESLLSLLAHPLSHVQELINFSKYVTTLRVTGNQCSWINSFPELVDNLMKVTERLQIVTLTDTHYSPVKNLLMNLITYGKVREAIFSTIKLSSANFADLMMVCSGKICSQSAFEFQDLVCDTCLQTNGDSLTGDIKVKCTSQFTDSSERLFDTYQKTGPSSGQVSQSSMSPQSLHLGSSVTMDSRVHSMNSGENGLDMEDGQISESDVESETNDTVMVSTWIDNLYDEALSPLQQTSQNTMGTHKKSFKVCNEKNSIILRCKYCRNFSEKCRNDSSASSEDKENMNCASSCNQSSGVGLTGFALICTAERFDICSCLETVFPEWTSLSKFCVFDMDLDSEWFLDQLMEKLSRHRISHLVLNLHPSFLERFIRTLYTYYRAEDNNGPALECVDLQACRKPVMYPDVLPDMNVSLNAVKKLDFSLITLDTQAFSAVKYLATNDLSLVCLNLNGCYLQEDRTVELLDILAEKRNMVSLNLSGNSVNEEDVETALVNFIQNSPDLTSLILTYCRLRMDFVSSAAFSGAIRNHRKLSELSIKNNRLEYAAISFLEDICCTPERLSLTRLNIGYNRIQCDQLVEAGQKIKTFLGERRQILDYLGIAGNTGVVVSKMEVGDVFSDIVKELDFHHTDFAYEEPYADYVAQM